MAGLGICTGNVLFHIKKRNTQRTLVGKSEGKRPLEDIGVNGRITLKCMLKKEDTRTGTGLNRLRIGTSCGLL